MLGRGLKGRREELDGEKDTVKFFVYGASTSVRMYAPRLVRRSCEGTGRRLVLIGVASKRKWRMLRGEPYGYDELVDYKQAD